MRFINNLLFLSYTLNNGQSRSEKGVLTKVGDASVYEVTGSYSFEGTDGKTYLLDYTSGVNGYKAKVTGKFIKVINFISISILLLILELKPETLSSVTLGISPDVIKTLIG